MKKTIAVIVCLLVLSVASVSFACYPALGTNSWNGNYYDTGSSFPYDDATAFTHIYFLTSPDSPKNYKCALKTTLWWYDTNGSYKTDTQRTDGNNLTEFDSPPVTASGYDYADKVENKVWALCLNDGDEMIDTYTHSGSPAAFYYTVQNWTGINEYR